MKKILAVVAFISADVFCMQFNPYILHVDVRVLNREIMSSSVRRYAPSNDIKTEKIRKLKKEKHRMDCVWDNKGRTVLTFLSAYKNKEPWSKEALQQRVEKLNKKVKDAINSQDEEGNTSLALAAKAHNFDLVKYLIDSGADVNIANDDGNTALLEALNEGYRDLHDQVDLHNLVIYLVEHGADINVENHAGSTPLSAAMGSVGGVSLVMYLIEHGANVNRQNCCGITPLLEASRRGDCLLIEYMLEHGADVNIASLDSDAPLVELINSSYIHWLQTTASNMIEHGADVNRQGGLRRPRGGALHGAASLCDLYLIRYLVEHGADVNREDNNGETALQIVRRKAREIEDYLIGQGAH